MTPTASHKSDEAVTARAAPTPCPSEAVPEHPSEPLGQMLGNRAYGQFLQARRGPADATSVRHNAEDRQQSGIAAAPGVSDVNDATVQVACNVVRD